jgi:hypothetical protein
MTAKVPTKETPIVRLDTDALMERARQSTGLSDFGDLWFVDPLRHLVDAINREAGLPTANVPPVQTLVDNLTNRLKLVEYLKRHPEVRDENVDVAGVIIAHARGGSTLLQRLLTASPQLTAPRWWELITPVPFADEEPGHTDARIEKGRAWIKSVNDMSPDHQSVHPMDAMAYEEEIMLINHSFLSMMYSAHFFVPGYQIWQMSQDHGKSYEELKLWLQLLQFQDPERRGRKWLLKSVQHMMACDLPALLKTFPDSKLIMTHRNLEDVIASLCSAQSMLIKASQSTTFNEAQLGESALEMYRHALENVMALRQGELASRFIDIRFDELVADPIGNFRRLMNEMGMTVTPADEGAATDWMSQNQRGSFPPHRYALEDYGLSRESIADSLAFYHERFLE